MVAKRRPAFFLKRVFFTRSMIQTTKNKERGKTKLPGNKK
jgi:hypothetical protein